MIPQGPPSWHLTEYLRALREQLAEVVELAGREAVVIERYGRAAAVMISPARYEELMDALKGQGPAVGVDDAVKQYVYRWLRRAGVAQPVGQAAQIRGILRRTRDR